ncbi:MAG: hypothetical protein RL375_4573 [Pseudomonadota bacterium]
MNQPAASTPALAASSAASAAAGTSHLAPIIDAHFHAWRLARGDYGWLQPELGVIYRDVDIAHWLDHARPLGVTGGVLVQAAPTAGETTWLLEQAAAHAEVLGVVGWADLLAPDAPEQIAALAHQPKLKGLRPMLHDIADPDWILQPALDPALRAMTEQGLVFDALVRPVHLPRIRELASRHPALSIVVDHGAKPEIASMGWQPWADELRALADESGAVCKLSGLLTEAGAVDHELATMRWGAQVLACFGPQRVLWGSDWPVLELAASYERWWALARQLGQALSAEEQQAVFGANAARVYRLG